MNASPVVVAGMWLSLALAGCGGPDPGSKPSPPGGSQSPPPAQAAQDAKVPADPFADQILPTGPVPSRTQ